MIPVLETDLKEVTVQTIPSYTHKMDLENERIIGMTDGQDAMKQVIFKILNTERYQYLIYSWSYGIELKDLFGQPISYVIPELKRRIPEALLQDDRITAVDNFSFNSAKRHDLECTFTAHTIFGEVDGELSVNV